MTMRGRCRCLFMMPRFIINWAFVEWAECIARPISYSCPPRKRGGKRGRVEATRARCGEGGAANEEAGAKESYARRGLCIKGGEGFSSSAIVRFWRKRVKRNLRYFVPGLRLFISNLWLYFCVLICLYHTRSSWSCNKGGMGVESLDGSKPISSAEEPRLYRLIGPIDEDELYRFMDEDELYRLMGSVDVGIDVKSDASLRKGELGIEGKIGVSSGVNKVSSSRVMSSVEVVAGPSLSEASGSMSVDNPSPKGSLPSTRRGRKRPSLLADLSWGKESKVEKLGSEAGVSISAGTSSGVVRRGEVVASKMSSPDVSGECARVICEVGTGVQLARSTAKVHEVEEEGEDGERPRKMSKVSGEGVSHEGGGCGQAWSRVASETSEGKDSFTHARSEMPEGPAAESVTALGAELKEKAHVTFPVDPCLGGKGGLVVEPEAMELGVMVNLHDGSSLVGHKSAREEGEEQVEKVLNACCDDVEGSRASGKEGETSRGSTIHTVSVPRKEELRVGGVLAPLMGVGGGQVDPGSWVRLLRQVPEVGENSERGEVGPSATYDEFAASIFRLVGLRNRTVREYESAEGRWRESLAHLEEQAAELRGLNDNLGRQKVALERGCEEERGLREGLERALCAKDNELEAVKAELERAEVRARSKEEEVQGLTLMLEKEREATGMVGRLREKVARLESDAARHEGEISAMDRGCRATLKRLLKEQADALYAGYDAKNGCMGLKLDHFLESRAVYDEAAKELYEWEGALAALTSLKEKDGIPVPDANFAKLEKLIDFQSKRVASLAVEDFHSGRLLLGLPEEIGAIEVERLDFKSARYS